MEIQINPTTVRAMVKRLRKSTALGQSAAYEAVSLMLGYPNWDTLSGLLKAEALPPANAQGASADTVFQEMAKRYNWRETPPTLDKPFMLTWEAYACDEFGTSPRWYQVEVTQEVLHEIHELQTLALKNACEVARGFEAGTWGGSDLRLQADEIRVDGGYVWVRARPKHCDYWVETRMMAIDELFQVIEKGQAAATPYLAWADGVLFKDGASAKEFAFQMLDDEVVAVNESCIDQMPS